MRTLSTLRAGLGVEGRGLAIVLCDVPSELYSRETRCVGDPRLVWRDARARVRAPAPRPTTPNTPATPTSPTSPNAAPAPSVRISLAPRRDSRRSLKIVWP